MFERYTEPARRTIFFARWWALNRKGLKIETSDIVLGAAEETRKEDSTFRWMNLDYDQIVALFAGDILCVTAPEPRDIKLSDLSKRALAYAAEEADLEKRRTIDVCHLVRGVLRTQDSAAAALSGAGYTLEMLRTASREANKGMPEVKSSREVPWIIALGFALLAFLAAILYLRSQN